ncbi:PKD domain-containing protein [bacterium]|nr:PKD domain-containing protein [bacterium]
MSHIYENKGKYLITAIATTSQGMKLTASMEVYLGIPKNQQYSLEIKSIFSSTKTAFSALYSGNFDKAVWSFDDGTVKTVGISENIVHIFEKEGLHLVQLK